MSDNKNRRSKIGLADPQHQLRFSFYLIGGGVTALMLIGLYLLVSLENSLQAELTKNQLPTDVSDVLLDHVGRAEMYLTAASLLLLVVSVFTGVKMSHRIYGPIVQIRRHIGNLIQGDYKSRVQLRDHDQFVELADDLNALAEKLQSGR